MLDRTATFADSRPMFLFSIFGRNFFYQYSGKNIFSQFYKNRHIFKVNVSNFENTNKYV